MNWKRTLKTVLTATVGLAVVFLSQSLALAQCAMCKNAITGSPDAARLSANFNFAVLVLLIPPVVIFCGIFVAVVRHRHLQGGEPSGDDRTVPQTRSNKPALNRRDLSRAAKNPDTGLK